MELEGNAPVTSPEESKVSTPHTVEEEEYPFPPEGFPYTGSIPASVPPNYVSLAQLVSGTPIATSIYHNLVWVSGVMPTSGLFISNSTSQQDVTSLSMQHTVLDPFI